MNDYNEVPRGNRSHFRRVNITMSPELLMKLKQFGAYLEEKGHANTDVSSLIRFACFKMLSEAGL